MRSLLVVVIVVSLWGCESPLAEVHCVTTAVPSVECEVSQTRGKAEVEVCWEFEAECENGAIVTAERICQRVKDGGKAKAVISAGQLTGIEDCAGSNPPATRFRSLTLERVPTR
jgi:hypothetical protein